MLKDILIKRRSVRRYSDRPVRKEDILTCLEAARLSPSACNSQPWKFIVVDDKELKNTLCYKAFSGVYSMNTFAKAAPVMIAVVSEKSAFFSAVAGKIRRTAYYLLDIGGACEHFILQAAELGLGTCWLGWFNEGEVKKLLSIPRYKKVDTLISLGYPDNAKIVEKTRKPIEEISSFNKY